MGATLSISIDIALDPPSAFDALVDEISLALENGGLALTPGPQGQLIQRGAVVGQIVDWEPAKRIALTWHPPAWSASQGANIELTLSPADGGSRVTCTCRNWEHAPGDGRELAG